MNSARERVMPEVVERAHNGKYSSDHGNDFDKQPAPCGYVLDASAPATCGRQSFGPLSPACVMGRLQEPKDDPRQPLLTRTGRSHHAAKANDGSTKYYDPFSVEI